MKQAILIIAFAFSITQIAAANGNAGSPGPAKGVNPTTVNLSAVPKGAGNNNGIGQQTPFGYEVSQQHLEDLKNGTNPGGGHGGSGGGGTSWTGGTTWHTAIGNGTPTASTGGSFDGPVQYGWIPYDAAIAVGPTRVLVLCNSQLAVYDKTHAQMGSTVQFANFWNTTNLGTGGQYGSATPFDPKCYYDPNNSNIENTVGGVTAVRGHFVMLMDQQYGNSTANMLVAVSETDDPTGNWYTYVLNWTQDGSTPTSNWGDYPSLGNDDNAIYIGANQYSFSNNYQYSKVRVLSKAQLFSGAGVTWDDFTGLTNADGSSAFTVKAGRNINSSSTEYLLNTRPGGGSSVTEWSITGAPSNPVLTRVATVTVGAYNAPPNARQSIRGRTGVATNDCRTQDLVIANGNLYTAFTEKYSVSAGSGAGIRYLNISTGGGLNADVSYFYPGYDRYFPAVTIDNAGDVLMVFSQSDPNSYASMWYTGQSTTESSFEVAGEVQAGNSSITDGRWGDYSGIANDPTTVLGTTSNSAVWMYCGYAGSGGAWATSICSAGFGTGLPKPIAAAPGSANDALNAAYPNPFSSATTISYSLPAAANARVTVVDAMGRTVSVLADGMQSAGAHSAVFETGNIPSGAYFYRLESNGSVQTRQMYLLR